MAVDWTRWQDAQQEVKQCLRAAKARDFWHSWKGLLELLLGIARHPGIRPERADPPGNRSCKSCNFQTFRTTTAYAPWNEIRVLCPALQHHDSHLCLMKTCHSVSTSFCTYIHIEWQEKMQSLFLAHAAYSTVLYRLWGRCSKRWAMPLSGMRLIKNVENRNNQFKNTKQSTTLHLP